MDRMTRWFHSKVDWWLGLILLAAPVVVVIGALTAPPHQRVVAYLGTAVLAAVYLGLVFPMRYGITDAHLIVRYGLVRQRIALADIISVEPTRSPLSSPALSLDRLRITFGAGMFKKVLISPADKVQFLVDLALAARLVRQGDGLTRSLTRDAT